ncbi:MAG: enoyl-CoA hydratase/isomerase family protein [Pseudomonadota bacterium]
MSTITSSLSEGVCTIAFNRPEALNAFTPDVLKALIENVETADRDPDAKVIVLTGNGRAFSAGVDLKLLQSVTPVAGGIGDVFDGAAARAAETIRTASTPVIARVHGACFTGALELALHCDFILTTEDTKFGDTHVKWGLRPSWGMSQNLARAVGVRRARELSFTARTFSGVDAARWGVVNEAAPSIDALDEMVLARAKAIAGASPGAVSAYKDLYRLHEENRALEDALAREVAREYPQITDTEDRLKAFGK